jgi:hypothetical protein
MFPWSAAMQPTLTRRPMPADSDPSGLRTLLALGGDGLWVCLALILALALSAWLGAQLVAPLPVIPPTTG